MTTEDLKRLVADGETLAVEFKGEEKGPLDDKDLVEAVTCLANRPGDAVGYLIIGVEDDGRVTGARPRHPGGITDIARIQALIANRTRPSITCGAEVVALPEGDVLVIEVHPTRVPVGTTEGRYLRRALGGRGEPECVPYYHHEMQGRSADQGLLDYSTLVVSGAEWSDLDPLEFERYRISVQQSRGAGDGLLADMPDEEIAKALGAVELDHNGIRVRVLALLLFGREESLRRLLPTHEVAFQVLSGNEVQVNEFTRVPLLKTVEDLMARFRVRNAETEVPFGAVRIGVPDYSERAFREAVANAVVHRDYTRMAAVHVQWSDDNITISNPGGFPEGVTLDNILVTPPRPRNLMLADALKRAGLVERTGRGIDTIFEEQLRNGRPAPSYGRTTSSDVILILPGGAMNAQFVRLVSEETAAGRLLRLDDLLVLNHLWGVRQLSTPEAARLLQKSESDARAVLQRLVESGLVEARGVRKGRSYHLSASTYQRLGAKAGYVRQKGFDRAQQEEMVIGYVRSYGRITRQQAAELCQRGPHQASRVLRDLRAAGRLVMHGVGKGAFYELRA